jgi:hypothetical protein
VSWLDLASSELRRTDAAIFVRGDVPQQSVVLQIVTSGRARETSHPHTAIAVYDAAGCG